MFQLTMETDISVSFWLNDDMSNIINKWWYVISGILAVIMVNFFSNENCIIWASPVTLVVPANAEETWVPSLGGEDPLEKGTAIHSSIPAWEIPWSEEPSWAMVHRVTKSQTQLKWLTMRALYTLSWVWYICLARS